MFKKQIINFSSYFILCIATIFSFAGNAEAVNISDKIASVVNVSSFESFAKANNKFEDGFKLKLLFDIPETYQSIQLKFDDFTNKEKDSTVEVGGNLRFSSEQFERKRGPLDTILLNTKNEYSDRITLEEGSDADLDKPGRQVLINVEVRVPVSAKMGKYSTKYLLNSIDEIAPIISVDEYNSNVTKEDITVNVSTNEGTLNQRSHKFVENGSFDFIARDIEGNVATNTVTISNIDKVKPVIDLNGSNQITIERTQPYVEFGATATDNHDGSMTPSIDASRVNVNVVGNYTVTYKAIDTAGNYSYKYRDVKIIDTTPPVITIGEYIKTPTNKDLTVFATTDEGTLNVGSHVFTENSSFDFVATNQGGLVSTTTISINNIDKVLPIITLNGEPSISLERAESFVDISATTTDNVTLSPIITIDRGDFNIDVVGVYKFIYTARDEAGNTAFVERVVNVVDTKPPVIRISEYIKSPTNKDITVLATTNEGVLNYESHIFSTNGSFDFVATDLGGFISTTTVSITNIDKEIPVLSLKGDESVIHERGEIYNDLGAIAINEPALNVTPDLSGFNKDVVGDYIVKYNSTDLAGNSAVEIIRNVKVVDTKPPVITISDYTKLLTDKDIVVTASVNEGSLNVDSHTFTANGSFDFVATDLSGLVSTTTVNITNIDKSIKVRVSNAGVGCSIVRELTTSLDTVNCALDVYIKPVDYAVLITPNAGLLTSDADFKFNIENLTNPGEIGGTIKTRVTEHTGDRTTIDGRIKVDAGEDTIIRAGVTFIPSQSGEYRMSPISLDYSLMVNGNLIPAKLYFEPISDFYSTSATYIKP